jgi:hypothetical protein
LQEPHGVTSQKTALFIVTALKTSNLTYSIFYSKINWNCDGKENEEKEKTCEEGRKYCNRRRNIRE